MDLAELANQVGTLDVVIGVIIGAVAWTLANAVGLYALARLFRANDDRDEPRWSYATAQAVVRLLATISGISVGVLSVWFIAL